MKLAVMLSWKTNSTKVKTERSNERICNSATQRVPKVYARPTMHLHVPSSVLGCLDRVPEAGQ